MSLKKSLHTILLASLVLTGCKLDSSTIDADSVRITRGNIRDGYVEVMVDVTVIGLDGYATGLLDKAEWYQPYQEKGYTMFYEVYDPSGELVEKRTQDLGKYGNDTAFSTQELTIPQPQWWTEDNPVQYTLVLRLKIINKPLSSVSKKFKLSQ